MCIKQKNTTKALIVGEEELQLFEEQLQHLLLKIIDDQVPLNKPQSSAPVIGATLKVFVGASSLLETYLNFENILLNIFKNNVLLTTNQIIINELNI